MISLAIGEGDKLGKVRNVKWTWRELCARLAAPLHGDKGAAGFFVGGTFQGEARRGNELVERSLIVLDADEMTPEQLAALRAGTPYALAVYSTSSHRPDAPRVRLVLPLAAPVAPEQYGPLARLVAAKLDPTMNAFDDCSFKANQLMYFPTVGQDTGFMSFVNEGEWLDGRGVLAEWNGDWAALPRSARRDALRAPGRVAADPWAKPGLIGEFCRTFTIEQAIAEFDLPYDEGEGGRFTYRDGTAANGAVVYGEGRWLFSNHYRDPAYGRLLNAFDLVRVHRFGGLEKDEALRATLELARGACHG